MSEVGWTTRSDGAIVMADGSLLLPWNIDDIMRMTPEMRAASAEAVNERPAREQRICVCGHPVTRHEETGEGTLCLPTRMTCHCKELRPVIDVSDTRAFLRKTKSLAEHALTRGIKALVDKGKTWRWLDGEPHCYVCGAHEVPVWPILVNTRTDTPIMVVTDSTAGPRQDILCCAPCCAKKWPEASAKLSGVVSEE